MNLKKYLPVSRQRLLDIEVKLKNTEDKLRRLVKEGLTESDELNKKLNDDLTQIAKWFVNETSKNMGDLQKTVFAEIDKMKAERTELFEQVSITIQEGRIADFERFNKPKYKVGYKNKKGTITMVSCQLVNNLPEYVYEMDSNHGFLWLESEV